MCNSDLHFSPGQLVRNEYRPFHNCLMNFSMFDLYQASSTPQRKFRKPYVYRIRVKQPATPDSIKWEDPLSREEVDLKSVWEEPISQDPSPLSLSCGPHTWDSVHPSLLSDPLPVSHSFSQTASGLEQLAVEDDSPKEQFKLMHSYAENKQYWQSYHRRTIGKFGNVHLRGSPESQKQLRKGSPLELRTKSIPRFRPPSLQPLPNLQLRPKFQSVQHKSASKVPLPKLPTKKLLLLPKTLGPTRVSSK